MLERNLCSESGCRAFCCKDVTIFWKDEPEKILSYWPNALKEKTGFFGAFAEGEGVFYKKHGVYLIIRIVGRCPNLSYEFNCKLEENKPGPCRDYGLGQEDCTVVRVNNSLISFREWQFNQNRTSSEVVK